jgi:putative tryptophan/tyrosine transport system substrate-binding protein
MRRREFLGLISLSAAWPLATRAQQGGRIPIVGQLLSNTAEREREIFGDDPFGLRDLGYVEGKNILIERR